MWSPAVPSVSHTYRTEGSYLIVGTVTDSFGTVIRNSTTVAVNPKPQPAVSIVATTTNPTAGTDMTFTASVAPVAGNGSVIRSVSVDFGDGTKHRARSGHGHGHRAAPRLPKGGTRPTPSR